MIKLGRQRENLRPIDLLLRQIQQQGLRQKQSEIESEIDKQYEMLREGRRTEMLERTKMFEMKQDDSKSNITDELKKNIDKKPLAPVKPPAVKIKQLTKLEQMKKYCLRGAMSACDFVKQEEKNKEEKNKYTTPDLIIDYADTKPFVKLNPIVKDLQDKEKLKDKDERLKASDAYKLGQQDKERESKMYHPETTIKMGYDTPVFMGSSTI